MSKTIWILSIGSLLLFLFFFFHQMKTVATRSQSTLSFAPSSVDLGDLDGWSPTTGTLLVQNVGLTTVSLIRVSSSCPCLRVNANKTPIPPGVSDSIGYELNPNGIHGKGKWHIFIQTSEKEHTFRSIDVSANVHTAFSVLPRTMRFGVVRNGEEKTLTLLVRDLDPFSTEKLTVSCPDDFLEVVPQTVSLPSSKRMFLVHFANSESRRGLLVSSLRIGVEGQKAKARIIPVVIDVRRQVEAIPSIVFFGMVRPGKTYTRTFHLTSQDGMELLVNNIQANESDIVQVEWEKISNTHIEAIVHLFARANTPSQPLELLVKYRHIKDQREFLIPIDFLLDSDNRWQTSSD